MASRFSDAVETYMNSPHYNYVTLDAILTRRFYRKMPQHQRIFNRLAANRFKKSVASNSLVRRMLSQQKQIEADSIVLSSERLGRFK